nr:MAG TPA: capsid protein [Cressdnaviricota sp.]
MVRRRTTHNIGDMKRQRSTSYSLADYASKRRRATASAKKSSSRFGARPSRFLKPGFTRSVGFYGRYGAGSQERKFFDTALNFAIDATGEVPATGQLILIPQGDTESTRDGRKATIKSVQIRGNLIYVPAAAATAAAITNMYLVLDTQCNGAAASAAEVFTGTDFSTAMLNLNNSGRFRILKHWVHTWNSGAGATTAYNNVAKQVEFFKKCEVPVDWSGATGAITEIRSNNIFLLASVIGAGSDDAITMTGTARVRFVG